MSATTLRILLMEDSPTAVMMVRIWLEELTFPYDLHTATTLAEGIQVCEQEQIGLIILDLNLPDSEGLDTFLAARDRFPDIPIVITSGDRDENTAITAVQLGASDYIVKGGKSEYSLGRAIRFALERTRSRQSELQLRSEVKQIELAREVQQGLFPEHDLKFANFDIAGQCQPAAETGGDYFDFFPMKNRYAVVIGDVSGHGLDSALLMIEARAVLRTLSDSYVDPGTIINQTNRILCNDLTDEKFVTLLFVVLDPDSRTFRYVSAGHPGYLFDANGDLKQELSSPHPPVGISADLRFRSSPVQMLQQGDIFLLFTDGVTDAVGPSNELFGRERLLGLMKTCRDQSAMETVSTIFESVRQHSQGLTQADDVTLLVVKCI